MRAPHPSLQRLFGLAAVPAQRGAAWQALDASLARLDAKPGGAADAQSAQAALMARLDTLAQGAPAGAGLAPLLDRLLGHRGGGGAGGNAGEDDEGGGDRLRGAARPGPWPAHATAAGWAEPLAMASAHDGQRPGLAAAGAALHRGQARPHAAGASASAATPASRPPAMPWPTRPAAPPALANASPRPPTRPLALAGGASAHPALGEASRPGQSGRQADRPALPAARPPLAWPDAGAARHHWRQRLGQAGLAGAWMAPMLVAAAATDRPAAPSGPLAWPGPAAGTPSATAGPLPAAASLAPATGTHSAAQALSQRLNQALQPLAAMPRPPGPASGPASGPATSIGLPASAATTRPPALTQGGRIGGFKGLAALGLPTAALVASAPAPADLRSQGLALAAAAAGPAAAAHGWPQDGPGAGPQTLIDQIEAALREQAVRNGISLSGLEPT